MKRKFNYFYQIKNKINGNYYFGVHKTDNLDDGYMGSGKRLKYAIEKYGPENFEKEILEFFNTYEEALDFEYSIVTEEIIIDPSCYNLTLGGGNGFNEWFVKNNYHIKGRLAANKVLTEKLQNDKTYREKFITNVKNGLLEKYKNGWKPWKGRKHSEETKEKMRNADRTGAKNSQYGTCWITNGKENKKIYKDHLIPEGWRLGRKI